MTLKANLTIGASAIVGLLGDELVDFIANVTGIDPRYATVGEVLTALGLIIAGEYGKIPGYYIPTLVFAYNLLSSRAMKIAKPFIKKVEGSPAPAKEVGQPAVSYEVGTEEVEQPKVISYV